MSRDYPDFVPPEPDQGIPITAAAPSAETASIKPGPRWVIVGVVIVAMIATAVGAYLFVRHSRPSSTPCVTTIDAQRYSADGTLPVDLLSGVPDVDGVNVLGVWCGVAVVDLQFQHYEQLTQGYTYFNTDVLRAFDVATGKVLWTVAQSPDGSDMLFNSAKAADGKLAVATYRKGAFLGPAADQDLCLTGTDIQILDLRTGAVLASSFLDAQCIFVAGSAMDTISQVRSVVAYQDGVVVLEQGAGDGNDLYSADETLAFKDTALDTSLWAVGSSGPNAINPVFADMTTDRLLPGGWVRTVTGEFMALADGTTASVMADERHSFFTVGGMTIEAITTYNNAAQIDNPWFTSIGGWTDLTASGPAWQYSPPNGWVIAANSLLDARPPYPASASPVVAVTPDAVIIMEMRFADYQLVQANLTAISQADGTVLWRAPYEFSPDDLTVDNAMTVTGGDIESGETVGAVHQGTLQRALGTIIEVDGRQYLVFVEPKAVVLADAASGNVIATQTVAAQQASAIEPCGKASVCLLINPPLNNGILADLMRFSVSDSSLELASDTEVSLMKTGEYGWYGLFLTDAGLFGVIRENTQYSFWLM